MITKLEYSTVVGMPLAIVTGELVFARHGRHLVMLTEHTTEEAVTARCPFQATLRRKDEKLEVESLLLGRPSGPNPGAELSTDDAVTGAVTRATRPEEIVNMTRRYIGVQPNSTIGPAARAFWLREWAPPMLRALRETVQEADAAARQKPRPGGRPPYGHDFYKAIALRCIDLFEGGNGRGVHKAIAQEYGKDPRTVADWIRKARKPPYEYLAPGAPGRVRFEPGPGLDQHG